MKKILFVLLIFTCCLLASCGAENGQSADGETGDYYIDFVADSTAGDGSYQITGQVHVEDKLPLADLQAQAETTLNLELTFNAAQGDIRLDYVKPDGELLPLCGNAVTDINTPTTMTVPLTVLAGKSCLQWTATSDEAAAADFKLTISNTDGVDITSVDFTEELPKLSGLSNSQADFYALAAQANNPALVGSTMGVRNVERELKAGQSNSLAYPAPKNACTLGLYAWLAEPQGDLQLIYVQPDGAEQVLWDSEGQEEWLINLVIDLLPGEGRLEWRTQNGVKCQFNIIIEWSEEAGVTGFLA